MGLDNYIYIRDRFTGEPICKEDILEEEYSQDYFHMVVQEDICYWRKFWSFRNDVVHDIIRDASDNVELTLENLQLIVRRLERYMIKKYYDSKKTYDTIWEWREYLPAIVKTSNNLRLLIDDIQSGRIDLDKYQIIWADSF